MSRAQAAARHLVGAVLAVMAPSLAHAQAAPSDYIYATRYNAGRRVTGTIAPDPDGTGPLHYAAVRNSYDPAGRLIRTEKGELRDWPGDAAPVDWGPAFGEYAGYIYVKGDKVYASQPTTSNQGDKVSHSVPRTANGDYHTHGD